MQINNEFYNDTKHFTHDAADKCLIADASDLTPFVALYDDACDYGLVLRRAVDGNITRWYVQSVCTDADNDLTEWVLAPCPETLRKNPNTAGYTLRVMND